MNTDTLDHEPGKQPGSDKPDSEAPEKAGGGADSNPQLKKGGGGLALFAMVIALMALLAAAWLWWQGTRAEQKREAEWRAEQQVYIDELKRLETSLQAMQRSGNQQEQAESAALRSRLEALEASLDADEDFRSETAAWSRAAQAALESSQSRLEAVDERLRNLSARTAESSTELELEEVDYLLRMAQERLELFGDTRTADRALQLADRQVQVFDNPMFTGLRREIAAARTALAAADLPDLIELGAELDKLQERIDVLPFRSSSAVAKQSTAGTEVEPADLPWYERLKNALSGLITVRRLDDAELAMPALADQQALRQRAWLEIEQARLAALRRDQEIYLQSLNQAGETIGRWFDQESSDVKAAMAGLQALQQRNVDPVMPDISGPWISLNSIRQAGLSPDVGATPAETKPLETKPNEAAEKAATSNSDSIPNVDPGPASVSSGTDAAPAVPIESEQAGSESTESTESEQSEEQPADEPSGVEP